MTKILKIKHLILEGLAAGLKYQEIADKYKCSIRSVKSVASEHTKLEILSIPVADVKHVKIKRDLKIDQVADKLKYVADQSTPAILLSIDRVKGVLEAESKEPIDTQEARMKTLMVIEKAGNILKLYIHDLLGFKSVIESKINNSEVVMNFQPVEKLK